MSDTSAPARALLAEATLFLSALGVNVSFDQENDGPWRYFLDGAAVIEDELIAKAVALGMMASTA